MALQPPLSQLLTVDNGVVTYNISQNIRASKLIPDSWDEIVIKNGVTLKGNFIVPPGRTKPLLIRGESKTGSVIEGLGNHKYYGIDGSRAFNHSAVYYGGGKAVITIENLTSKNPDFYHLLSRSKIIADNVRLISTSREPKKIGFSGGDGSIIRNSFIGTTNSDGSIIRNSFIGTTNDAINIYRDEIVVENVLFNICETRLQSNLAGLDKTKDLPQ